MKLPMPPRWTWHTALAAGGAATLGLGASLAYNGATRNRELPGEALYDGPFVTLRGRRVAYQEVGSTGPAILLLGGFAEASWVWTPVAEILGADHRVFALDLAPFGYSERTGPYTLDAWASTVWDFISHFELDQPTIVGHSLGAATAVSVALAHPEDVAEIVLLSGDALHEPPRGGSFAAHLGPLTTSLYRLLTGSNRLFSFGIEMATGIREAPSAGQVEIWQRPFQVVGTQRAFMEMLPHGVVGHTLAELESVAVPAHVIWGQDDKVLPIATGRTAARALRAPLTTIPGAGHLPMLTHPSVVAETIAQRPISEQSS